MYTPIMVKMVSLSDKAYGELKRLKNGKSFSEVVLELIGPRQKDISQFFGAWKEKPEMERIFRDVEKVWKKSRLKGVKF